MIPQWWHTGNIKRCWGLCWAPPLPGVGSEPQGFTEGKGKGERKGSVGRAEHRGTAQHRRENTADNKGGGEKGMRRKRKNQPNRGMRTEKCKLSFVINSSWELPTVSLPRRTAGESAVPSGAGSLLAAGSGLALGQPRAVRAGGDEAGLWGLRPAGAAQGLAPRGVLMLSVRLARPVPVSVPAGSPGGSGGTGVALALGPETGSWAPVPRGSLEGKRVGG